MKKLFLLSLLFNLSACTEFFYGKANSPEAKKLNDKAIFTDNARILWTQNLSDESINLQSAYSQQNIFSVDNEGQLKAFDANNGQLIYEKNLGFKVSSGLTYDDGYLYLGSENGNIWAINAKTGDVFWHSYIGSKVESTITVKSETVFVRGVDGTISALNARDGDIIWNYYSSMPKLALKNSAQLLVEGGTVVILGDNGYITLLDAQSGFLINQLPLLVTQADKKSGLVFRDANSSPKLIGNVLFGNVFGNNTFAINLENGKFLWQQESASTDKDFALSNNRIFLSDVNDHLVAIDIETGRVFWRNDDLEGRNISAPTVSGQKVFVIDDEGYLHTFSAENGEIIGRKKISDSGTSKAAISNGSTYFWQLDNGQIFALESL